LFFDNPNLHVGDRLGRQTVVFGILQSENITGKVKASDLATPVARHPRGANGTANDFVNVFSKIVFANNLALALIRPDGPHTLNAHYRRPSNVKLVMLFP
jgi:hypothetical protein